MGNNWKGDSYFATGGWRVWEVQAAQSPRRLLSVQIHKLR